MFIWFMLSNSDCGFPTPMSEAVAVCRLSLRSIMRCVVGSGQSHNFRSPLHAVRYQLFVLCKVIVVLGKHLKQHAAAIIALKARNTTMHRLRVLKRVADIAALSDHSGTRQSRVGGQVVAVS